MAVGVNLDSADRLAVLTDILIRLEGVTTAQNFSSVDPVKALEGMALENMLSFADEGDDMEAIFEEVFRGGYDIEDLHSAMHNVFEQADDIDGDYNATSSLMFVHMGDVQALTAQDPVDYGAVFKEVLKAGVVAQSSNLIDQISGKIPDGELGRLELSEFTAGMQAMAIVAINMAEANGVDIEQAMREVQDELQPSETCNSFESSPNSGAPFIPNSCG